MSAIVSLVGITFFSLHLIQRGSQGRLQITEYFNSVGVQEVELEKEQWAMGQAEFDNIVKEAREYITKLEEAIDEESKELDTTRRSSN